MTYLTRIQRERQAELLNQIYLTKYFKSNTLLRLEIFIYKADKCYIHHTINPCTYENFPSTLTLFLLPNHVHICSPFILFTITIEGSPSTHHWRQIPLKLRLKPLHDFDRVFESIPKVCVELMEMLKTRKITKRKEWRINYISVIKILKRVILPF